MTRLEVHPYFLFSLTKLISISEEVMKKDSQSYSKNFTLGSSLKYDNVGI